MLVQLQRNWAPNGPLPPREADTEPGLLTLGNLRSIARRRALLIAGGVLLFLLIGFVYLLTTRSMYTSNASLYLDIQNAQMAEGNGTVTSVAPLGLDDVNVNSQVVIMQSEKIAKKVIEDLGLKDLPEFSRSPSILGGYLSQAISAVKSALRFGQSAPVLAQDGVPRGVIESFARRLSVSRVDETFVISIGFTSEDPQRAADIANAVASAYLDEKLDARYDSVRRASTWMEGRLAELRQQAVVSDRLVQQYKSEHGIIDTNSGNGQLLSDTQLTEHSARLGEAQKDTAQKQARYDQIQQMIVSGNPDASVVDSLASPVINELRQQYSQASQQESDITRRYGPDHEAAVKFRRKMEDINALILQELTRIAQVYRSDLEAAKSQEADLAVTLDQYTTRSSTIAQALVRLRELERDAQSDQNLYESFLDRYKSALQQQSFPITDARVLTAASPPRAKSSPKTVITLALSGIAGLALGLMLALGRELIDSAFRSPAQVERLLNGVCLGALPKLARNRTHGPKRPRRQPADKNLPAPRYLETDLGVFQHTLKQPLSRFAETLRAVKLATDFAEVDNGVRVIGVVSSVPGEGKSTVAMNIAQLVAAAGNSVLIIDADLRSPTLTHDVTPRAQGGLLEYLLGTVPINDLVYSDQTKPLKFLPAAGKTRVPHTSDLIGSSKMADLIKAARQTYDYVVVDLPPLAPVVDAKAVAGAIDGFVYVIEWGQTSVATVTDALHNAPSVRQKLIGFLLNKADMQSLRFYTSGDGKSEYYSNDKFSSYISRD